MNSPASQGILQTKAHIWRPKSLVRSRGIPFPPLFQSSQMNSIGCWKTWEAFGSTSASGIFFLGTVTTPRRRVDAVSRQEHLTRFPSHRIQPRYLLYSLHFTEHASSARPSSQVESSLHPYVPSARAVAPLEPRASAEGKSNQRDTIGGQS
jgi:hypothetical protein